FLERTQAAALLRRDHAREQPPVAERRDQLLGELLALVELDRAGQRERRPLVEGIAEVPLQLLGGPVLGEAFGERVRHANLVACAGPRSWGRWGQPRRTRRCWRRGGTELIWSIKNNLRASAPPCSVEVG